MNMQDYSLFINSLLSNKEILIKSNDTIQITECSVFKHSKTIIPVDLIDTQAKQGSRLDYQWLLFAMVSFIASSIFIIMAVSQHFAFSFVIGTTFAVLGLLSIFASFKFRNTTYAYRFKGTNINLFTLTENDLNSSQISEFVNMLNPEITDENNSLENTFTDESQTSYLLSDQLNDYYKQLNHLFNEDIIDEILLKRLQQNAHNKVFGVSIDVSDDRPLANVIPLPVNGKVKA